MTIKYINENKYSVDGVEYNSKDKLTESKLTALFGRLYVLIKNENGEYNSFRVAGGGSSGSGGTGPQGLKGEDGLDGSKGDPGAQGPKGDKGDTGDQGPIGPQGPIGITGSIGPKGDKGEQGDQGIQGLKGDKGEKGDKGDDGLDGVMGPQGPQGIQGIQGEKGDKGETGDQGEIGPEGPIGKPDPSDFYDKTEIDNFGYISAANVSSQYMTIARFNLFAGILPSTYVSKASSTEQNMNAPLTSPKYLRSDLNNRPTPNSNEVPDTKYVDDQIITVIPITFSKREYIAGKYWRGETPNFDLYGLFNFVRITGGDKAEINDLTSGDEVQLLSQGGGTATYSVKINLLMQRGTKFKFVYTWESTSGQVSDNPVNTYLIFTQT